MNDNHNGRTDFLKNRDVRPGLARVVSVLLGEVFMMTVMYYMVLVLAEVYRPGWVSRFIDMATVMWGLTGLSAVVLLIMQITQLRDQDLAPRPTHRRGLSVFILVVCSGVSIGGAWYVFSVLTGTTTLKMIWTIFSFLVIVCIVVAMVNDSTETPAQHHNDRLL